MNPAQLLEHFDHISEAPGAVARLRRFILNLAVRGKLVEQDPSDEPAAELFGRIQAEKARRIEVGEIRSPRSLEWPDEIEELFSLPILWMWVRLADVGAITGGGTPPSGDPDNFTEGGAGAAWLTPADLGKRDDLYVSHGARDLTQNGLQSSSATVMPKGSVLFTSRAPIGYVAIAANEITTNQGFKSVVPYIVECSRYIAVYLKAFGPWVDSKASGTTFREVSGKIVSGLPFPLPPLAEQQRIVTKVDELMALCDQLEAAKNEREARRDRLVAASLHRIGTAPAATDVTATETQSTTPLRDAARFHLDHLPRLTTRPEHIKQLRQTILSLAVRGRLVPQDPNDEPAAELLKCLQAEKARSQGRNRALPIVDETERPFKEPSGWLWTRLGDVLSIRTGFAFKSSTYSSSGTLVFRVTNFDREGSFDLSDSVYFPSEKIDEKFSKYLLQSGEIIMVMVGGTIGKTTIVNESILPALLNQNMWRIRSFGALMSNGFEFLLVKNINQSIQGLTQSTHGHFAMSDYELKLAAIPPLAEQHRIVAKVDELMAMCDQLEAQLTATQTHSRRLLEAVLHEALALALEKAA